MAPFLISFSVNKKQRRTLDRVFALPTPADIPWRDIEVLFRALGASITEAKGRRIVIRLKERTAVFHRPHPKPEAKRGLVRAVREFLKQAGIEP